MAPRAMIPASTRRAPTIAHVGRPEPYRAADCHACPNLARLRTFRESILERTNGPGLLPLAEPSRDLRTGRDLRCRLPGRAAATRTIYTPRVVQYECRRTRWDALPSRSPGGGTD